MALAPYESPTFLGQKDKYLAGLSLPQLMGTLGMGLFVFVVTLLLPMSFVWRMVLVLPLTGVAASLVFVRISGLSVPSLLFHAVTRAFSRPVYEEHQQLLIQGGYVWVEAQARSRSRRPFGWLRRAKGVKDGPEMEQRARELRAEFDGKVVEGAMAAEQAVRDGIRTLMKAR